MCQRKSHYPDFMRKGHSTCHCKISEDSRLGSRFLNQAGSWHGMWLGEALNHPTNLVVGVINDPTSPSPSSISLVDFPISPIHYLWETFTPDSLHLLDTDTSTCHGCQFSVQKNHFAIDNDMEAERPGHSKNFFHLPTGCVCRCTNFLFLLWNRPILSQQAAKMWKRPDIFSLPAALAFFQETKCSTRSTLKKLIFHLWCSARSMEQLVSVRLPSFSDDRCSWGTIAAPNKICIALHEMKIIAAPGTTRSPKEQTGVHLQFQKILYWPLVPLRKQIENPYRRRTKTNCKRQCLTLDAQWSFIFPEWQFRFWERSKALAEWECGLVVGKSC